MARNLTGRLSPKVRRALIRDRDISPLEPIAESHLDLNYPTHDDSNDPTYDEKQALDAANAPSAENPFATMADITAHDEHSELAGLDWQTAAHTSSGSGKVAAGFLDTNPAEYPISAVMEADALAQLDTNGTANELVSALQNTFETAILDNVTLTKTEFGYYRLIRSLVEIKGGDIEITLDDDDYMTGEFAIINSASGGSGRKTTVFAPTGGNINTLESVVLEGEEESIILQYTGYLTYRIVGRSNQVISGLPTADEKDALDAANSPSASNPFATMDDLNDAGAEPATTVESETSFGITPAVGTGTKYAREDHTHGSPAAPTASSVGAPALVNPSVADNFVAFSDTAGNQKDSGKKASDFAAETANTIGALINGATDKATPVDADLVAIADTSVLKKLTWANLKTTLATYFNSLYLVLLGKSGGQTAYGGTGSGDSLTLEPTSHSTKGYVAIATTGNKAKITDGSSVFYVSRTTPSSAGGYVELPILYDYQGFIYVHITEPNLSVTKTYCVPNYWNSSGIKKLVPLYSMVLTGHDLEVLYQTYNGETYLYLYRSAGSGSQATTHVTIEMTGKFGGWRDATGTGTTTLPTTFGPVALRLQNLVTQNMQTEKTTAFSYSDTTVGNGTYIGYWSPNSYGGQLFVTLENSTDGVCKSYIVPALIFARNYRSGDPFWKLEPTNDLTQSEYSAIANDWDFGYRVYNATYYFYVKRKKGSTAKTLSLNIFAMGTTGTWTEMSKSYGVVRWEENQNDPKQGDYKYLTKPRYGYDYFTHYNQGDGIGTFVGCRTGLRSSGTPTLAQANDSYGIYTSFATGAVTGNAVGSGSANAGGASYSVLRLQKYTEYSIRFISPSNISDMRLWCGLFSGSPVGADDPSGLHIAAIRYSSGDANLYLVTKDGTTINATSMAYSFIASRYYTLKIRIYPGDSVMASILEMGAPTAWTNKAPTTNTTNLPSSSQDLGFEFVLETKADAAKTILVDYQAVQTIEKSYY